MSRDYMVWYIFRYPVNNGIAISYFFWLSSLENGENQNFSNGIIDWIHISVKRG